MIENVENIHRGIYYIFLNCDEFCITVLSMIRPPQAFLNCQKISAPFVTLYDKVLSWSLGVAGPVRSHDM